MTRLAVALGAQRETLTGLCGLGDLVLTCSSPQSRNMSCGLALGRGGRHWLTSWHRATRSPKALLPRPAVMELAARHGVDMPICEAVAAIVEGKASVDAAITGLLSRPFTSESA